MITTADQRIRSGLWTVILLLFIDVVSAAVLPKALHPNHPKHYRVQEGDSEWTIAERFLENPGYWPQVLASPLQPGDEIYVVQSADERRLEVTHTHREKLHPEARATPIEHHIPGIPMAHILPFLNDSLVLSPDVFPTLPRIVGLKDEHIVIGQGEQVYISGLPDVPTANYLIVSPGQHFVHPESGDALGQEAVALGVGRLLNTHEPALLEITTAYQEMRVGDLLWPQPAINVPTSDFYLKQPENPSQGLILSVLGGVSQIGQYQVVSLTGGADIAREAGDVLGVFQPGGTLSSRVAAAKTETKVDTLPPTQVGTLVVFKVFEQVSFALVTQASRAINLHDMVWSLQ